MSVLDAIESPLAMSASEKHAHQITTTPWASNPSSPSVIVIDETLGIDVTTTVYPTNSPSANGDVISLSLLQALTVGHRYRVEVQFTTGSNIWEVRFYVECIF